MTFNYKFTHLSPVWYNLKRYMGVLSICFMKLMMKFNNHVIYVLMAFDIISMRSLVLDSTFCVEFY